MTPSSSSAARYGVDAPDLVRNFLAIGAAGCAVGTALAFSRKSAVVTAIGAAVAVTSLVPFAFGVMMAAYAVAGKTRTARALLGRREWRGDEVVLDVGAGRGILAIAAAKRVPRGRVVALDVWRAEDLSGNGAAALRANAKLEGVEGAIEILTADARNVPLPDASVDVVVSLLCLHNIEPEADRTNACREIARVLKPGGRAIVGDYTGSAAYARALRDAGLAVTGPIDMLATAYSLMAFVDAVKPAR